MRIINAWLLILANLVFLATAIANDPKAHRSLIEAATTSEKGDFHVVFTETIGSKDQRDWKNSYGAKVEVFHGGKSVGVFNSSTLPNFAPAKDKPKDWKYAVVQATCGFPSDLQGRFYTWSRTLRADGKRPCLRLAREVPTVNLSSARADEMALDELLSSLVDECKAERYFQFAENILVHSGHQQGWRGSAGCLTIDPKDSDKFFDLIPKDAKGTLELNRGIEDKAAKMSFCY